MSTALSRKSSSVESGSIRDLSGFTRLDPVPPSRSVLQEPPKAPLKTKRSRSKGASYQSPSPQRGHQMGRHSVKQSRSKTRECFLRKNIVAVSFFQNCVIGLHQYS